MGRLGLVLQSGTLPGEFGAFEREFDFRLPQLLPPQVLQLSERLAFLANGGVEIERPVYRRLPVRVVFAEVGFQGGEDAAFFCLPIELVGLRLGCQFNCRPNCWFNWHSNWRISCCPDCGRPDLLLQPRKLLPENGFRPLSRVSWAARNSSAQIALDL